MNSLDHYAPLFGDTDAHRSELGTFTAEVLQHAGHGDTAWCEAQIEKLSAELADDPDTYCDLLSALEELEDQGDQVAGAVFNSVARRGVEKTASWYGNAKNKTVDALGHKAAVPALMVGGALAGTAIPAMAAYLDRRKLRNQGTRVFRTVMETNAHLRNDPSMDGYYSTISRFAPHVAADPVLLTNTLSHLQSAGPAALSMASVKSMADVSRAASAPTGLAGAVSGAGSVASVLAGAAKNYTGMRTSEAKAAEADARRP